MGVGTTNKRVDRATKLMGTISKVFLCGATLWWSTLEWVVMMGAFSRVSLPFCATSFLIFGRTSMQLAFGLASRSSTLIFWLALLGPSRWCACVAGWTDLGWRYSLTFASLCDSLLMKSNASLSRIAFAMHEGCGLIADGQACIDQPLEDPPRLR
jgi:hypothetical protein